MKMEVRQVPTPDGWRWEPALDVNWSQIRKLWWQAGVTEAQTGLFCRVTSLGSGDFNVQIGLSATHGDFYTVRTLLQGAAMGVRESRRQTERASSTESTGHMPIWMR